MRFNAVIAAAILAATVSGAALPIPQDSTAVAEAQPDLAPAVEAEVDFEDDEDLEKRGGWTTKPYRPIGLPGIGKREAEADGWTTKPYRPIGLPGIGKREAEAGGWTTKPYRPIGLPGIGRREAEAEAEADGWTTNPYRPIGLPGIGKGEAEAEAEM
jgi:mating pheromone alpha-factor